MVHHGRTAASATAATTPNRWSVRRPSRGRGGGGSVQPPLTVILPHLHLLLLCISTLCILPTTRAISGGEELSSFEEEPQSSGGSLPNLQASSLSAAASEQQLFQIADQQAYIGKLFYYHIATPAGLRNLSLLQAGHHLNLNGNGHNSNSNNHHNHHHQRQSPPPPLLPEWLHFNADTGELFGAPLEKKIYFIQVTAILDGDEPHGKTYEDIFVIEVLDAPAYLSSAASSAQRQLQSSEHGSISNLLLYQCRIELKAPFTSIAALYQTIVRLHGSPLVISSSSSSFEHHREHRDAKSNSIQLAQWLNRFNVEPAVNSNGVGGWKASYDVEQCGTSVQHQNQQQQQQSAKDHIYLDQNSEQLLSRLSEHRIESELVKISSSVGNSGNSGHQGQFDLDSSTGNGFGFASMRSSSESEASSGELPPKEHQPRRNSHRRRNVYADDPDAYSTPTLKGDWRSLTTSTIDLAASDLQVLSRTAIPSMVSPTFTGVLGSETVVATPVFGQANVGGGDAGPVGGRAMYPHLYSTPVLMPDISSLSMRTYDEAAASILATPVIPQMVASTSVLLEVMGVPTQGSPSLAIPEPASNLTTAESTTTSTTSTSSSTSTSTTTTTEAGPSTSTLKPNHRPFVNRRIAKLSITAGKYWQYSIPESTFMDVEDGNTKALRLAFFKDSELPPIDYWIQFDHENQYLYALPTEENIGRYRFNLVAMDTAGAEVTETLEIYVRQPRESLTYTHRFILANVSWDANNLFVERIQAVSSLLQRMATQIFEEASSQQDPAEAVQKQTILHSISVLSITRSGNGGNGGHGHGHGLGHHDSHFTAPAAAQQSWTITWSNDSLRRTPCPEEEVNALFSKLYDITYPSDANGFMQPSPDLKNALSPEFSIMKVKREFIGRSACGSFASIGAGDGTFRQKEKIVFSNRLNRLGPYKVGLPFRFVIPKDTVYSANRQGDSSELDLSLAPVEPANYIPEWIFFDVREQTIYGLPYKQEHVQTLELKLIAEDRQTGGREADIFAVDVILDKDTREDYLLEVTMSFAMRNVEKLDAGNLKLTAKDYYQLSHLIATRLMGNSNLEAFRMLEINRYRFTKMDDLIIDTFTNNDQSLGPPLDPLDSPKFEDPKADQQLSSKSRRSAVGHGNHHEHDHHHQHLSKQQKKRRRSYHHLRFRRGLFQTGAHGPDYFYEFIWTNRSLVTSYLHSANAFGGGTLYETDSCPKDDIKRDLYDKLFPRSSADFAASVSLAQNGSHLDVMEIYSRLFESIEANVEFLSVEWTPKSVCQYTPGLDARTFGAKPIKEFESDFPPPGASPQTPPQPPPTAEPPTAGHPDDDLDHFPTDYSSTYLGDKLLTMIIPPIAILTALLFAVTIGCCFHRANLRRKAMGNMTEITEENPNLYRQRIPIQFEFERGGGPGSIRGMGVGEQEAMLDGSKMGRHPIQIMPMKRGIGGAGGHPPPLPGHGSRGAPKNMIPGQHMQYQMLPQQHQ